MPKVNLTPDATIRDVVATLAQPEEYVCVVLGHLSACNRQHGSAHVRIGVTGRGLYPSHKVFYKGAGGSNSNFGVFDGQTPFSGVNIHKNTWSAASMDIDEVKALIGEMRSFNRTPTKIS